MPLLGKKIFVCSKPPTDKKPDEPVYTIQHTKEQFLSKKEYERRLAWYKENIWTCQCTGHINLTHEDAWNSEKSIKKTLKSQFPTECEKSVLEIVHHSTLPLDSLVDQAWLKLQQVLYIGEKVNLKIKSAGNVIKGVVTKIDTAGVQANPTSNCSSPSSDKENCSSDGNSPKKWTPPKLLPYKYSIQLDEGGKIVNAIPAEELVRCEKPPSKDLVRFFIRANAIRAGQTTPWIVDDILVKKYSLPRKFSDFLMSPVKMSEGFKKSEEENLKKRKASSLSGPASKKAKIDKIKDKNKNSDNKKQTKLTKSPLKNSPLKSLDKDSSSKKSSPKKSSKTSCDNSGDMAKSKKQKSSDSSCSEDIPLSSLKSTPSKNKTPVKNGKSTPKKNTPSKKQSVVTIDSDSDDDRPLSDVQPLSKMKSGKSPKKGMKQMTLFDMKKKLKTPEKKKTPLKDQKTPDKGLKTPDKKPKFEKMKTPIIVTKLVKAVKSEEEQKKINALVLQAAKILTSPQRKRLPENVKEMVLSKYKKMEEQKRIDSMTPEQKAEYFKQKKLESKRKMREKQSQLRKRFEDQDLEHKALPQPKLVSTPDGLPNELFGDVAMVTEFISCYAGLLMPDDEYPIFTDALMKALTSGKEGFTYLSRVLVVLLQTLLQDQISEDYQEIKVALSDIPVNPYTSSELARLCLRKQDVDEGQSDISDVEEEEEDEVPDDILQLLETKELYQLDADQKLQILKGLCLRIMGTYSVQDYMEEKQQTASKLWKRKLAELKQKNDQLRKEKVQKKEDCKPENPKTDQQAKEEIESNALVSLFYGKSADKEDNSRPSTPDVITSAESTADEAGDDLASVVKRRRLMTAKAAAEKDKIEQEKRKLKEKEYELYKKQVEKEKFEKEFDEGIRLAKMVLRQSPIGTDRNHNKYWVFSATTPGLYIEKGWVTDDIEYRSPTLFNPPTDTDSSDDDSDEMSSNPQGSSAEKEIETSVPHTGQNLWFTYDAVKDLDKLIDCLHNQGFRESQLKAQLKKFYPIITRAINQAKRINLELRDSNGDEEMLNSFKKELLETETRLRHGGLGGVDDFDYWSTKLETANNVSVIGQCLLETEKYVIDKFREGIMKKKKKVPELKEEEKEDEEEEEEKEEIIPKGILKWREAVENSSTYSRLHVLLGVLDANIKWEKSAENAKCKICRRKDDDATLLLCDECNQAFHMQCLRPALTSVPRGDWLCPACAPQRSRDREKPKVNYTGRSYKITDEISESEDEKEEIEHEEKCVECGGDEELIYCAECPAAYHLECHEPPLRRPPRGQWSCNECKTGVKRSSRSRTKRKEAVKQKRAPPRRRQYKEESESEEEESEEESEESDDASESEEEDEPPAKAARRSQQQKTARQATKGKKTGKSTKESNRRSIESEEENPKSRRAPSDLSDEKEEIEHEEKCVECGGDEELIYCAECPAAYHLECHEPPLRRPPRGQWSCNECKTGTGVKRSSQSKVKRKEAVKQKKAPSKRKRYEEESESEEEESEEESEESDDASESEEEDEPPAKAARKSQQQQTARQATKVKKTGTSSKESNRRSIEIEEEKPKSRRAPSDLSLCLNIINEVMKHPSSWPFVEAVSKKDVPDYHNIVKHPMDFQKIKDKLRCMVYGSVNEVVKDVQLIFSNSEAYNKPGTEVLQCTEEIERYFANLMKKDLPLYSYERKSLTNGFADDDQPLKSRR